MAGEDFRKPPIASTACLSRLIPVISSSERLNKIQQAHIRDNFHTNIRLTHVSHSYFLKLESFSNKTIIAVLEIGLFFPA
jgi:hypothetical protein